MIKQKGICTCVDDLTRRIIALETWKNETEPKIKEIKSLGNSIGAVAEQLVYFNLENDEKMKKELLGGDKFKDMEPNRKNRDKGEYDIVLFGENNVVCIIEVKVKADWRDISNMGKKAKDFRNLRKEYSTSDIHLALVTIKLEEKDKENLKDKAKDIGCQFLTLNKNNLEYV